MIYTCYEMIEDCRADKPEGWSYFIIHYVPLIRKILEHYFPVRHNLEQVLAALHNPKSNMFLSMQPSPERVFVFGLRQHVLRAAVDGNEAPEIVLDLDTVAASLEPLTLREKEVFWLEVMRYDSVAAGRVLRMDSHTVEKIREKAAEQIRANAESWRRTLITENSLQLSRAAEAQGGEECVLLNSFLDIIDGRANWYKREETERHIVRCWHCIDRFCRAWEVSDLLRGLEPLPAEKAAMLQKFLGIDVQKRSFWRKVLAR